MIPNCIIFPESAQNGHLLFTPQHGQRLLDSLNFAVQLSSQDNEEEEAYNAKMGSDQCCHMVYKFSSQFG
jgi:hypothetical protein